MLETDKKLEKISQSMEDAYEYKERFDTSKDIPYFQYEKNDGKHIIESGFGNYRGGASVSYVSNTRQID